LIRYSSITLSETEPSNALNGDWWIKPLGTTDYQAYIKVSTWKPVTSGGAYKTESDPDTHYINTIIQEDEPSSVQNGWVWIKESLGVAYMYLGKFVTLA